MYFEKSMTIASPTAWPAKLLPPPRGSSAIRSRAVRSTTRCTSSACFGKTTPMGTMR